MSNYRRAWQPGGTFFLTLVAYERRPVFVSNVARITLRRAIAATRRSRPFDLVAAALLPDPLHLILQLPVGSNCRSAGGTG